ncbi:hypothetical protein [Streptomyces sp. NPDC052701]|uniref:hypothetical protein n=1 Tax=Streptomyces sp. NPDC052701 TaxID=3155533 RepID=UPI003418417D
MPANVADSLGRPGTAIDFRREVENPEEKHGSAPAAASSTYMDDPCRFTAPGAGRVLRSAGELGATPLVRTTCLETGWTDRIG